MRGVCQSVSLCLVVLVIADAVPAAVVPDHVSRRAGR